MNRLYYEALKYLPDEYIDDETLICIYCGVIIVASNPRLKPIFYKSREWKEIDLTLVGQGSVYASA
jgi:hypothetical protein